MRANLWKVPLILNHNRVKRAYVGGKLLDEWQGIEPAQDGQYPEEYLISTVEVTNADRYPSEGVSKVTLDDGSEATLKEIIAQDPIAFLGEAYARAMEGELGVLARVGDPIVRHVIQTHPNQEFANRYLDFPYGKDEVWYVIKTRQIDGETNFAYAGFKPGLTRQKWQALFDAQDIEGMLDAMHKLDGVREGDVLLIPAGMPHAIGPGSLFLEVHEPCDYTFRMERKYLTGRVFSEHEIHYGIGEERLFKAFCYETYSLEDIRAKVIIEPVLIRETSESQEYQLITYKHTPRFAMNKIVSRGAYKVTGFDGHRIAIVTKGFCEMIYPNGKKAVRQGQGVFLPAGLQELKFYSDDMMEVIIAFPPQIAG